MFGADDDYHLQASTDKMALPVFAPSKQETRLPLSSAGGRISLRLASLILVIMARAQST